MPFDAHGRPLRALRVSVTDRCNLRCQYCMPEQDYVWLPKDTLLHFEEIQQLAEILAGLGVDKVRLTGGEPLLRRDLPKLVHLLAAVPGIKDLALTTNGVLLAEQAEPLAAAGLNRITVSLDTLDAGRFTELTRMTCHARILEGIALASRVFGGLKLDMVVMRGINDGEIAPMLEYARGLGAEVRFIEYMDVAGATRWSMDRVLPRAEMLKVVESRYGAVEPVSEISSAPADRFRLPDGTVFGIVASTTTPFCSTCDRSRLTADGLWYLCLYATHGTDLRTPLRRGDSPEQIRALVEETWQLREDRGAEERLASRNRSVLVPLSTLKTDPHLEMHTRGG
jgi:cyclic pyranopterin phosphate synthase